MTSIIIVLAAFFIMYLIVFLGQIKRKRKPIQLGRRIPQNLRQI